MTPHLRILIAHQVPAARTGGMSRIMGFIHDQLERHGHHVDYYCADDVPPAWRTAAGRRFGFPLLVRKAAVEAARRGVPYDIVNVHEPHALPLTFQRRQAGFPSIVVTSHGLEERVWTLAKEEARLGRRALAIKTRLTYPPTSLLPGRIGLQRGDHVFCLNADDRQHLIDRFGRAPESITRIYPGADIEYSRPERKYDAVRKILFAAAWRENKGITDLVPAFINLADRHPELTLAVVGPGVSEHVVQQSFPERLRTRIVCDAPADERGMAEAFAACDLFLLPSLFEGTPLTLVQAMMSGLPIVTTSTCGMKDVIAHETSGLLIPIRSPKAIVDAVERLVVDGALRERLGGCARTVALDRYTWDKVAIPVEQAYLRVVARRE